MGEVDKVIVNNADDGSVAYGSFWDMYLYAGDTTKRGFLRWRGVTIDGVIGENSYIELLPKITKSGIQVKIYCVKENNPAAPINITEFNADPLTTASVEWNFDIITNVWIRSPSIAPILQELVDAYTMEDVALMVRLEGVGGEFALFKEFTDGVYSKIHIEYAPRICTEEATKCVGYDLYTCTNNAWVLTEENSATCGFVCTEEDTKCVGYDLYTCTNNAWVLTEENSATCGYVPPGEEGLSLCVITVVDIIVFRELRELLSLLVRKQKK